MLIKEKLNKDDLTSFTSLNGWLEKFKLAYGICEMRITDEADNVSRVTIQLWIERLPKLTTDYELKNICNMDELGLFFKALSEKTLAKKLRSCKDGKKSKQRFTAAFFVAADGSKVSEPVSQLLFGKANHQDVLRTFRTRLDQVWCNTSETTKHGCKLK